MQKQKHGFWLFIFSLIPGAGEMYMGFKKQGLSIMLLFWGVFAVGKELRGRFPVLFLSDGARSAFLYPERDLRIHRVDSLLLRL